MNRPPGRTVVSTDRRKLLRGGGAFVLSLLAGCTSSTGSAGTDTPTPVPQIAAIPYTAEADEDNVGTARNLRIRNRTESERRVRVTIRDTEANVMFYRRDHIIQPDAEPRFLDLMAKKTTYRITFDWEIGLRKSYDWPVDDDHWHATATIGGSPGDFTMTFGVGTL